MEVLLTSAIRFSIFVSKFFMASMTRESSHVLVHLRLEYLELFTTDITTISMRKTKDERILKTVSSLFLNSVV